MRALGKDGAAFVKIFTQCDERRAKDADLLEHLVEDVFALNDEEFPITQCVEETHTLFGVHFPVAAAFPKMKTEYGRSYHVYPKAKFVELAEHFEKSGLVLKPRRAAFPLCLRDYG